MSPLEIIAIARETIGTPYQHQQRINGVAMDCAGVPVYVARRIGLPVDDVLGYGRQPMPDEMRRVLADHLVRVPTERLQIGDVVWMRFRGEPQHLGIVGDYIYGGFSLIHAYNGAGIGEVIEHRMDHAWRSRIVAPSSQSTLPGTIREAVSGVRYRRSRKLCGPSIRAESLETTRRSARSSYNRNARGAAAERSCWSTPAGN